jgi:hypothetical protein
MEARIIEKVRASFNKPSMTVPTTTATPSSALRAPQRRGSAGDVDVPSGRRFTANGSCFNCGEMGHWRNECPYPLRPRRNDGNRQGNGGGRGSAGQATGL